MSTGSADIATTWSHTTAEVPARGLDVTRAATPAECAALALTLDIPTVEHLEARYRITALAGGRYRLAGRVSARIVQACIVSLDPVPGAVSETLDVEFRPAEADTADEAGTADAELSAIAAEEHEPIEHNRLAVGRIIVETLSAALPAYPRAPGAELEQREAGPAEPGAANPFAALAGWKPKAT